MHLDVDDCKQAAEAVEIDATHGDDETFKRFIDSVAFCLMALYCVLSSNLFCNQYKCPYLFRNELVKGIHLMREM